MKKALFLFFLMLIAGMLNFSLSFAEWGNYATPQLEWISNAFPSLWGKPKEEVFRIMEMFPDYICTDYESQIACKSRFNNNEQHNNIFLNFFTDDYEEKHDNLWKVAVTADIQAAGQNQELLDLLWIKGLVPHHSGNEEEFGFPSVIPLFFRNKSTEMVVYFQQFDIDNNPFFLAEYYDLSVR